jgi:hypothetical protein
MVDLLKLIWWAAIGLFRSRASLEAEVLTLRHQLNVLRRKSPKRLTFSNIDRLVFATLCRLAPCVVDALAIVQPETVIRWHRAGFRLFWRWKSRCRCGRPKVSTEIRQLIREMSQANPLWGAPRIHGELLKLGIEVGLTSVVKYMARTRRPPSQGWNMFLRNHADGIASIDLFVVPTISFRLLYAPMRGNLAGGIEHFCDHDSGPRDARAYRSRFDSRQMVQPTILLTVREARLTRCAARLVSRTVVSGSISVDGIRQRRLEH